MDSDIGKATLSSWFNSAWHTLATLVGH